MVSKETDRFLKAAIRECRKFNISVHLVDTDELDVDGVPANGVFDHFQEYLLVATAKPFTEWFPVFVHEYSHFRQWAHKTIDYEYFTECADAYFTMIQTGTRPLNYEAIIEGVVSGELDCEKIAVYSMRTLNMDAEFIDEYIRRARVYLKSYWWSIHYGKWIRGIYDNPSLSAYEPTTLASPLLANYEQSKWVKEIYTRGKAK